MTNAIQRRGRLQRKIVRLKNELKEAREVAEKLLYIVRESQEENCNWEYWNEQFRLPWEEK